MNRYEKKDIESLPSQFRPLGAWGYFGYSLLFSIPLVGLIALIVCMLSASNINRRSFARSYLCREIIAFVVVVILFFTFKSYIIQIIETIREAFPEYTQAEI